MTKSKTGNLVLTEQEEDTLAAFMQTPTDGNTPAQKIALRIRLMCFCPNAERTASLS